MYYCWSNVNAANGNNAFSYDWTSTLNSIPIVNNVLTVPANTSLKTSELISQLPNTLYSVSTVSSNSFKVSQSLSADYFVDGAGSIDATGNAVSQTSTSCVISVNKSSFLTVFNHRVRVVV